MRFEYTLVALAATSVAASQPYAPPPAYGETSPAPAPPAYGGAPASGPKPEQPPYGGEPAPVPEPKPEEPPYGGEPEPKPDTPPYGGEPEPKPDTPPYGGEEPKPEPTSTECGDHKTTAPEPTESPCLGYDCPKPDADYTTYTTCITTSVACEGEESCPPVTITSTIIEPCTTAPVTTTTYVTKPCPSCEEETITSTITITETAPYGKPTGPAYPVPVPETTETPSTPETPATPETPSYPVPETPACPGGESCPTTLVPQPQGTGAPACADGSYSCGAEGNATSPVPEIPSYGSGASRFTGSVAASIAVVFAAAFML